MTDSDGSVLLPQDLGIGRLFEAVRDAVVVADVCTGRIVLWNPAASKIFGYSRTEALGLFVEALIPPAFKDRHRAGLARYRETGTGRYLGSDEPLDLPALRKGGGGDPRRVVPERHRSGRPRARRRALRAGHHT